MLVGSFPGKRYVRFLDHRLSRAAKISGMESPSVRETDRIMQFMKQIGAVKESINETGV